MTKQPTTPQAPKKQEKDAHPGMLGDGTEEQNLNQPGNPSARISKEDVDSAFGTPPAKK